MHITSKEILVLIIDLFITVIAYMSYPYYKFKEAKSKYTEKDIKKTILYNSVLVCIAFVIIRSCLNFENPVGSFAPALFYYYINISIWKKKAKKEKLK